MIGLRMSGQTRGESCCEATDSENMWPLAWSPVMSPNCTLGSGRGRDKAAPNPGTHSPDHRLQALPQLLDGLGIGHLSIDECRVKLT